jgi:hypothetical protein
VKRESKNNWDWTIVSYVAIPLHYFYLRYWQKSLPHFTESQHLEPLEDAKNALRQGLYALRLLRGFVLDTTCRRLQGRSLKNLCSRKPGGSGLIQKAGESTVILAPFQALTLLRLSLAAPTSSPTYRIKG